MRGKRIAIFGLGRSGFAIGKAALALGADPTIFDEKREEELVKRDLLEEARSAGLTVRLGSSPSAPLAFDLLVTNPAVDMRHPVLKEAVAEGIEVLSEVEFAYRISKAPVVGITGTNGKSTTTVMTYLCVQAAGVDAVLCGNIYGSGYPEVPLTEAALANEPDQILVAEISSFQLEWVRDFRPVAAGVANVSLAHQDRYDSFEQYAATKRRIYAAQQPENFSIYRPDDPRTVPDSRKAQRLTFGIDGKDAVLGPEAITILGRRIDKSKLPFREPHNHLNACMAGLLAYGALVRQGRSERDALDAVELGLSRFKRLAHRMQPVGEARGVLFVNNSMCTNPEAIIRSVESLARPAHVLVGGVNKDLDFRPLGDYLRGSPHTAYLYGSSADEIAASGVETDGVSVSETMQEAFSKAVQNAKSGDAVILAPGCASMDQFRDFVDRGNVFTSLAMEWLQTCSAP